MGRRIDISPGFIFRAIVILLACWFLYVIRDVIALFLIAIIITAALGPVIRRMQRRMPRALAVVLVYITFFTTLGLLISFIVPTLSTQLEEFGKQVPASMNALQEQFGILSESESQENFVSDVGAQIAGSLGSVFSTTVGFFSGLISIVAVIAMSFYMSLREDGMKNFLLTIVPGQHQKYAASLTERIQESFGRWMAGQLVTMIFVGVLYYFALLFLGVPFPLILAIIGGLLEIVPYFGPILSAVPAAILGFLIDPLIGGAVIISYILINFLENYFLVPKIMNRAVGLHPVAVILALLIGAEVAGVIGVILAVPIAGAIGVFAKDLFEQRIDQTEPETQSS